MRIEDQRGATCTFENNFRPYGAIAIDKTTLNGTGTAGFTIQPLDDPQTSYEQSATTRQENDPTRARGDKTSRIRLGRYVIQEAEPAPVGNRAWRLLQVLCDGEIVPSQEGRVVVRLTRANPKLRCEFVNVLGPEPPQPPVPPDPPNPPDPGGVDLSIVKTPDRPVAAVGERVGYTVVIRNRSAFAAESVVVADQPGRGERPIVAPSIRRRCGVYGANRPRPVYVCGVGTLGPGEVRRYKFELLVTPASGSTVDNIAAVTSASSELHGPQQRVRHQGACPQLGVRPAARHQVAAGTPSRPAENGRYHRRAASAR